MMLYFWHKIVMLHDSEATMKYLEEEKQEAEANL